MVFPCLDWIAQTVWNQFVEGVSTALKIISLLGSKQAVFKGSGIHLLGFGKFTDSTNGFLNAIVDIEKMFNL